MGAGSDADGGEMSPREEVQQQGRFKFAFSSKSKAVSGRAATGSINGKRERDDDSARKEYLTEVDERSLNARKEVKRDLKSIPALPNVWRPKLTNVEALMRNVEEEDDRFETTETVNAGPEEGKVYGLIVRIRKTHENGEANAHSSEPQLGIHSGASRGADDDKTFREEVEELPEEADMDAYASMPIEEFGEAILRGMGWEKGKAIGRNAKGIVEPVEYVRRPVGLGLGATPQKEDDNTSKKYIRPGESRAPKPDLVAPCAPDGKVKHVKSVGEKLVERKREGVEVGKTMVIVGGRHEGLRGKVLSIEKAKQGSSRQDMVMVRLSTSDESVTVQASDLADIGSLKEEEARKCNNQGRRPVVHGQRRERKGGNECNERDGKGAMSSSKDYVQEGEEGRSKMVEESSYGELPRHISSERTDSGTRPWLMSNIRVRFVSKSFERGRLYLKKGTVIDVVGGPRRCDVKVDGTREILQQVRQDVLETALPKPGGRVVILSGPHQGDRGKLLERNNDKGVAVVQLAESFEVLRVLFEAVAEYVGDLGEYEA